MNENEERRRCIRIKVDDDLFEVYCHQTGEIAPVVDICKDGLCCRSFKSIELCRKMSHISIMVRRSELVQINDISCKVVYAIEALSEKSSFKGQSCRQIGLEFLNLKSTQKHKLSNLINESFPTA